MKKEEKKISSERRTKTDDLLYRLQNFQTCNPIPPNPKILTQKIPETKNTCQTSMLNDRYSSYKERRVRVDHRT